jgi:hypothetical protein
VAVNTPLFYGAAAVFFCALGSYSQTIESKAAVQSGKAGNAGERRVARVLWKHGLEAVNDLTVLHHGRTHQLDHIVLASDRLYVLETKTWRGKISGALNSTHWTLTRPGKSNLRVYNPLLQNDRHADVLRDLLRVPIAPLLVSAAALRAAPDVAVLFATVKDLPSLLGSPRPASRAIRAAFVTLQRMKDDPRQARVSVRHIGAVRFRFGGELNLVCWLFACAAAALCVGAIYA